MVEPVESIVTGKSCSVYEMTQIEDIDNISIDPILDIIDFLARKDCVVFKNQQVGDFAISTNQKKKIAREIYEKSKSAFLSRFGEHLKPEHLNYFRNLDLKVDAESYELSFHLNRLQRYHSDTARRIDVKNRRYQALQKLICDGSYFSEKEMRLRNPLLYEQLVGQYLTENEIKARDNLDTNITFVNLLMEKIDRDRLKAIKQEQENAERSQTEEEEDDEDDGVSTKASIPGRMKWGEFDDKVDETEDTMKPFTPKDSFITPNEKRLFREEFLHEMYSSFLEGRDIDFDYNSVDNNHEYDNVEIRARDEEENYFDSETPESEKSTQKVHSIDKSNGENESEDELEVYMNHLSKHHSLVNF